jgi:hypothetical protein
MPHERGTTAVVDTVEAEGLGRSVGTFPRGSASTGPRCTPVLRQLKHQANILDLSDALRKRETVSAIVDLLAAQSNSESLDPARREAPLPHPSLQ